jgi:hypothetical protein
MNRLSNPVWLDGGWPGADTFFRVRMLDLAERRTKAPNRDRTFRSALVVASMTFFVLKKNPLNWSILRQITSSP